MFVIGSGIKRTTATKWEKYCIRTGEKRMETAVDENGILFVVCFLFYETVSRSQAPISLRLHKIYRVRSFRSMSKGKENTCTQCNAFPLFGAIE